MLEKSSQVAERGTRTTVILPGLKTSLRFYSATLTCFPCGLVGIPSRDRWARRAMALA
jgi:hypothetical protein